jgi:hypothetical protein
VIGDTTLELALARPFAPFLMLLVAGTVGVAGNIVAEAGLSFLGLGAQPPTISWGVLLAEGHAFLTTSPWVAVFPGLPLMLAVLGVNLLGDGLRNLIHRSSAARPPLTRGGAAGGRLAFTSARPGGYNMTFSDG